MSRSDVLFVCTGNIFRSLTAEYALRRLLESAQQPVPVTVASAGTEDAPHRVKPIVRDYLLRHGIDVRGHRRRTLTRSILDDAGLVVAMSTEHRTVLAERFGRRVPLFTEACGLPPEPLPDVDEAVADHLENAAAAAAHIEATIDRIVALMPRLAARIGRRQP